MEAKKKPPTKAELARGEADGASLVKLQQISMHIESPQVLNSLLFFCIRHIPGIFDTILRFNYAPPTEESKSGSGLPKSSKKWRTLEKIVTSFIGSILKLLSQITEPKVRGKEQSRLAPRKRTHRPYVS